MKSRFHTNLVVETVHGEASERVPLWLVGVHPVPVYHRFCSVEAQCLSCCISFFSLLEAHHNALLMVDDGKVLVPQSGKVPLPIRTPF